MLRVPDAPAAAGALRRCLRPARRRCWRALPTPEARALWAGVAAHAFRPFGAPMSSAIGVTLGTAAHRYGWPVAEGGSAAISGAMISLLEEHGATFETGVQVDVARRARRRRHRHARRRARGRRADRRRPHAAPVARALTRFRHGPGTFKVDFAVAGRRALDARAVAPCRHRARRRQLRARSPPPSGWSAAGGCPTGRSCWSASSTSPTRAAPTATSTRSTPTPTCPPGTTGDATARIEAQIERFAPGFRDRILARHVRSVAQMEAHNANYVGGDVVTGANDPRQMVFRPRAALDPVRHRHPRRLPVLGGHAAGRRRPRHVRLQRRRLSALRRPA